jgi:hypothetical protein
MSSGTNWNSIATMIFEGTKWDASEEEIKLLAKRLCAIEERGLSKLNKRLIEGGKKIWDTFAEHNFCNELIDHNPFPIPIFYEPNEFEGNTFNRPPDFVIRKGGVTFWVQMKNLSETERENRRAKDIEQIKKLAKDIKVNKFFWCDLSEDFNTTDVKSLIDFISTVATDSIDDKVYLYPSIDHIKVKVTFWKPNKAIFEHLTLGGSGGIEFMNVTGESSTQIRNSLYNAAGAFKWVIDNKNINLIAMEIGNISHHNIDLGEAVFGDEVFSFANNGRQGWHRTNNGFFNNSDFCDKVAGVIALKRKEHLPVITYTKLLFINDRFKNMLKQINSILEFDRVIYFNKLINDKL